MHPLKELIEDRKKGIKRGIYSACTASPYVIKAVLLRAKQEGLFACIEATANQVNQFGGYTGMKPADYAAFVYKIADETGFDKSMIILGGDHLGPLTWQKDDEASAMSKSVELIKDYIMAGFTKIHVDTSMYVLDDDHTKRLADEKIAARSVKLIKTAEEAFAQYKAKNPDAQRPVYIIGSEVPIPGGAQDEDEGISVTKADVFVSTVRVFEEAFRGNGISDVWQHVVGFVVQPGVEFGDASINEYDRMKATELTAALKAYPDLVFEGHSTDYQTPVKLKEMVEDGIAILKVGPALTFAQREGLFALAMMEEELLTGVEGCKLSDFINVLENVMLENPGNWIKHYHGDDKSLYIKRKYSFSDRCRYYLPESEVSNAMGEMLSNLEGVDIPLSLISQYMPVQYNKIRQGILNNSPKNLILDRIINCIDEYIYAIVDR